MRILHITPSYFPAVRYGGPIVSVHGLCRALVEAGHQVDVFTTLVNGDRDLEIDAGVRVDVDAVGVYYFPTATPRRWYYSARMSAALHTQTHTYDIVHIHALFLHPTSTVARAAQLAHVPYLISPRGMLVRSLFEQRSHWLKTTWMTLLGRRILERAAAVHVTSALEHDEISAFKLKLTRMIEIPNGVDAVQSARCGAARDPNLVLFLGRLSWKKQIDRLIHAMVDCPSLCLVVVGNDDEGLLPTLRAQAQSLGIANRVQFQGPVQVKERDEWYARAGMFVLPSRSENFANTVLEAMAAGCPVIVTAAVGLSSIVGASECGIVCDDTSAALSTAMRHIATDKKLAAAMGVRGQRVVEKGFLWSTVAARMGDVYAQIAHQSR